MSTLDSLPAVLSPHGPIGAGDRLILLDSTAIMLAVVIPVICCTIAFAWWFRSTNRRAKRSLDWQYSGRLEFITWTIPALIILFLGGVAWIGSHELDPPKAIEKSVSAQPPLEIQVVSLDWKWLFIYPNEGIATVNYLVTPVGTPLHFTLTSATVMNSFFVPQLGSQIYTMPGMTTRLNLLADDARTYSGISAQFSGDGFSDMRFQLKAVAPGEFTGWVEKVHSDSGHDVLDALRYAKLALPTQNDAQASFGSVSNGLFEAIVHGHGTPPAASNSH
jgi:cytochrome o ubiquinol oxidase subunit II